jgi:putative sigma-54 modulation protein
MNIPIIDSEVAVTDGDSALVIDRINALTRRFNRTDSSVVSIRKKNDWFKAELVVVADGMTVRCEKLGSTLMEAVILAADFLESQLAKYQSPVAPDRNRAELVVREKHFPIRRLELNKVVLEMELSDHDFFLFQDIDSGEIKLLYRRADGKYGLLVPHANDI